MSQFEYVAVLVSIIVGLALTQILRGVGRVATDKHGPSTYWVHSAWTLYLFLYTTMFWWWEFQLVSADWSLSLYLILIVYATLLYFSCLVVQPSSHEGLTDFKVYYFEKKHLIYGTWIAITLWDKIDTFAKGIEHFWDLGPTYYIGQSVALIGSAIAIFTKNERFHQILICVLLSIFCANMIVLFFVLS